MTYEISDLMSIYSPGQRSISEDSLKGKKKEKNEPEKEAPSRGLFYLDFLQAKDNG